MQSMGIINLCGRSCTSPGPSAHKAATKLPYLYTLPLVPLSILLLSHFWSVVPAVFVILIAGRPTLASCPTRICMHSLLSPYGPRKSNSTSPYGRTLNEQLAESIRSIRIAASFTTRNTGRLEEMRPGRIDFDIHTHTQCRACRQSN